MLFRWLVTFLLLLAAGSAYGNELRVDYVGQTPDNVVAQGVPITYSFNNAFIDDGVYDVSPNIGTGIQISVDGQVIEPSSGIFSSNDDDNDGAVECEADPNFSNAWKCDNLGPTWGGQEYSFTWTPPQAGEYVLDFLGFCQEQPVPDPSRLCDVNGNEGGTGTVAYVTTVVGIDTDGDGIADADDPDDDNDGIIDELDTKPLMPSNLCTFGDFDDFAFFELAVVDDVTCAARERIGVLGETRVMGPPAHLHLIAPTIIFESGFDVLEGGLLTVISANPCPGCDGYEIGDTGPGGGIVFYVTDGGYHGLEAAPADQSTGAPWGCYDTETGADGLEIGTGAQNTAAILESCGETGIAAKLAFDYSLNGFDDWFLPSFVEAVFMLNRIGPDGTGDLGFGPYWSSTEYTASYAWYVGFFGPLVLSRSSNNWVRAVRAF